MRKIRGLAELVERLDELDGRVDVLTRTRAAADSGDLAVLLDADFLVADEEHEVRSSWTPWHRIEVLRQVPWDAGSREDVLDAWFRPHSAVAPLFDTGFGDADVPTQPAFPDHIRPEERVRWWTLAALLSVWERRGEVSRSDLKPATRIEIAACEHRIGASLPDALHTYHRALGMTATHEEILPLSPDPYGAVVAPLLDTYPGIPDLLSLIDGDRSATLRRMADLVAFGAYLGNGNHWCFDRTDGSVWYFDHDGPEPLTRMFDDPGDYFDALTVCAIGAAREILGEEDTSESVLIERIGVDRVRTWLY